MPTDDKKPPRHQPNGRIRWRLGWHRGIPLQPRGSASPSFDGFALSSVPTLQKNSGTTNYMPDGSNRSLVTLIGDQNVRRVRDANPMNRWLAFPSSRPLLTQPFAQLLLTLTEVSIHVSSHLSNDCNLDVSVISADRCERETGCGPITTEWGSTATKEGISRGRSENLEP